MDTDFLGEMTMLRIKRNQGFTLIELMIVVAIIGILAAIAIPNFIRFQLRSKAGEGKLNLTAIRVAEASYFGEYGTYVDFGPQPSTDGAAATLGPISTTKRQWGDCPTPPAFGTDGHCVIGFYPEGPTYYDYGSQSELAGAAPTAGATGSSFFADAVSDIDGDTNLNLFGLRVPLQGDEEGAAFTPTALNGCAAVVDEFGGNTVFGAVGPCVLGNGVSVF